MAQSFIDYLSPLLGTLVVWFVTGVAGWFVTHFFGRQILRFHELRASVHEALIFAANVLPPYVDREAYKRAVDELRRLAAQILALDHAATRPARWYFRTFCYDLKKAGRHLIGVSTSLGQDYSMAFQRHGVERALRLPVTHTDQDVEELRAARLRRP
jgi:hypothetical protein